MVLVQPNATKLAPTAAWAERQTPEPLPGVASANQRSHDPRFRDF